MAALLELVALHRLEYRIEHNNLNSANQYGFTALRGRHDLMARIMELAMNDNWSTTASNASKKCTTIISLDIEGAFDNVNHDIMIDKMIEQFQQDKIGFWLAKFVLNRKICICYNKLRAKQRRVMKGVPQGSALGPILFNYLINSIEQDIQATNDFEILKYADDIIVIKKGYDKEATQSKLDMLIDKLKSIGPEVNPNKCSCLVVKHTAEGSQLSNNYFIDEQVIKQVRSMNILGMRIKSNLTLDRRETKIKIRKATKRLAAIHDLDIIHTSKQWNMLIESILTCHTNINDWSTLAYDKRSRDWIDREAIKHIKLIFDWPTNVSSKLVRLVMKLPTIDKAIEKMITLNQQTEHYGSYEALEKLFRHSYYYHKMPIAHTPLPIARHLSRQRRYHDPTMTIKPPMTVETNDVSLTVNGPLWILIDRKEASIMSEIIGTTILEIQTNRHMHCQTAYFNTLATVWKMIHDTIIMNRKILFESDNAILQALMNNRNNDWRIIKIRERMIRGRMANNPNKPKKPSHHQE